jgi:hypothetical protein
MFPLCRALFGCGLGSGSAQSGIVRAICNGLAVNVRDCNVGEIVHRAVVKEAAVLPGATFVTDAIIAKAVIYTAIKAKVRPPLSDMKDVDAFRTRRRQQSAMQPAFRPMSGRSR